MAIKNVPTLNEQATNDMRGALEHRATWMYLLMDEARKKGLDWNDFARKAIFRCGCMTGENLKAMMKDPSDMVEFSTVFGAGAVHKVFEMEQTTADENKFYLDFHYCPLVAAWQKLGCDDKEVELLCDIAMDGDRGIAHEFPAFEFTLGKTIAQGNKVCEIRFNKK